MRNILSDLDINVVQFDLPPQDPDACLHLMSVVSPLDHDLALIYEPLMPNNLQGVLKDFGYDLLSAPVNELS